MQYTITINQAKALEWGLNSQQALLFSFVYECPSWANSMKTDSGIFFALSKAKIVEELPLLTDKPDTAYRLLRALEDAGLIELASTSSITLVRLTKKAKEWNRKLDGSEKYPTATDQVGKKSDVTGRKKIRSRSEKNPGEVGNISEQGRKKIRPRSEKSPTNQDTSNQVTINQGTNQETSNQKLAEGAAASPQAGGLILVGASSDAPRVEIPEDMPGPKDPECKTYKAWANYAMAYRKRYHCWPVWNASAGGMLGKLVDRLGVDVAHRVAGYYLGINDAQLIRKCHSLNELLANAEAYHTQWATKTQMNGTTARQKEQTQANINAAQEASRSIREGGKQNAFLRRNR